MSEFTDGLFRKRGLLCTVIVAVGVLIAGRAIVSAQPSDAWAITRAQNAVKQQVIDSDRGQSRGQSVRFNNDAQTERVANNGIRVTGSGEFSGSNRASDNGRREFSYEAVVRNGGLFRRNEANVSEVRFDWRDSRGDNRGRGNNGRFGDNSRGNNGRGINDRGTNDRGRPNGSVSYSGPIVNRNSDKALDVAGQSSQDGARVQQWTYSDQPNQNWDVVDLGSGEVALISRNSGLALTVQGGRDMNGASIIQRTWNDSRQQKWRLEDVKNGYYRIVSVDSGKCLDVSGQGREDGAPIQLWDYANQANQQWRLKR